MNRPLRILVVALSARTGGGRSYVVNQLAALSREPGVDMVVHATGVVAEELRTRAPAVRVVAHRRRPLAARVFAEQFVLAWVARTFDAVYSVGNFALLACSRPQVLVVKNAWYFSEEVRRFRRARCPRAMRLRLVLESTAARWSIRKATRVATVSHSMRAAIEEDLGPLTHLSVIASAATVLPTPGSAPPGTPLEPYVLFVAHDDPHKEWDRLIAAFARRPDLPLLVVAGRARRDRPPSPRVRLLGEISDPAALSALYAGAACYLAHSRFESFGFTPTEALMAGVPVVASDIPAHRETCGDRALYYDVDATETMLDLVARAVQPGQSPDSRPPTPRTWVENAHELASLFRSVAHPRSSA